MRFIKGQFDTINTTEQIFEKLMAQIKPPKLVGNVMGMDLYESEHMREGVVAIINKSGGVVGVIDARGEDKNEEDGVVPMKPHPSECPSCSCEVVYYGRFGNEYYCDDCGWSMDATTGEITYEGEPD